MNKNNRMKQYNNDIDHLMDRFFSHQATDSEIRTLEEWVMDSDQNRTCFLRRRAAAQVIDATITPENIDCEKALRRISSAHRHDAPLARRYRITARILAVAASVLLILCVTLTLILFRSHPADMATDVPRIVMSAPFGSMVRTTLPDGSTVWLNANSSIKYPAAFVDSLRDVSLKGEAFFQVSADKSNPFVVNTPRTTIVATGTQFNVNAYREPAVTLVEGNVDVCIRASDKHINLTPGDHLAIKGDDISLTHNSDVRKWCGWRDGMLVFDNDPLIEVFERLGQIHNIIFTLKDDSIGMSRCHATFTGENISNILHLLELSAPIKFVNTSSDTDTIMHIKVIPHRSR